MANPEGSSRELRRLLEELSSATGRRRRLDMIRANALPAAKATSTAALGGE